MRWYKTFKAKNEKYDSPIFIYRFLETWEMQMDALVGPEHSFWGFRAKFLARGEELIGCAGSNLAI